jgi:hypothetical protein
MHAQSPNIALLCENTSTYKNQIIKTDVNYLHRFAENFVKLPHRGDGIAIYEYMYIKQAHVHLDINNLITSNSPECNDIRVMLVSGLCDCSIFI